MGRTKERQPAVAAPAARDAQTTMHADKDDGLQARERVQQDDIVTDECDLI